MIKCAQIKPRAKPLDLIRRAKLLGVTPGHLSKVISGKRQSLSLRERLAKLLELESTQKPNPKTTNH
jgi:predicted transcriptional regulator